LGKISDLAGRDKEAKLGNEVISGVLPALSHGDFVARKAVVAQVEEAAWFGARLISS